MSRISIPSTGPPLADEHLAILFSAKAVGRGGVVRRQRDWVDDNIGRERLIADVRRRGFGLIEVGAQYVVICAEKPMRVLV